MKKFRRFTIIWGTILVMIFCLFTTFSIGIDKKLKKYRKLEDYFAQSVSNYNDNNKIYPKTIEVINITLEEAIEKGIVEDLRTEDDICDGYVKIANDSIVTYTPYIKCNKYTTKGYDNNLI